MTAEPPKDSRLQDWLDDKIQTPSDLEAIDKLLISIRDSHALFLKQLRDARREHDEAESAFAQHQAQIQETEAACDSEREAIKNEMMAVTNSKTAREATKIFNETIKKLNQIDAATEYINVLQTVETLKQTCLENISSADFVALDAYSNLYSVMTRMRSHQESSDDIEPFLKAQIKAVVLDLTQKLKNDLANKFRTLVAKIQWPRYPEKPISNDVAPQFSHLVSSLLKLQKPELDEHEKLQEKNRQSFAKPMILLPIQILVEPLWLGFKEHFEKGNVLDRLDKPEVYLSYISSRILEKYNGFFQTNVQQLLLEQFKGTSLDMNLAYIDITSAFVTAVLPIVSIKSLQVARTVSADSVLLSHLIRELIAFDKGIREDWLYEVGSTANPWPGISGEILSTDNIFSLWLQGEKDYALSRYREIVEADNAFELDFDSLDLGKTKPSNAAIKVRDLLQAAKENYQNLVLFTYKLRFLIDVQVDIFDLFYTKLESLFAAFIGRTSSITRISKKDQLSLQGIEGLKLLCGIFGSADFLEKVLQSWNDDTFFLELWVELQQRAAANSGQANVAGALKVDDVASRTSKSLQNGGGGSSAAQEVFESGAIFDETASAYGRLRSRAEKAITELVANNVRNALQSYTRVSNWSSLAPLPEGPLSTTAELDTLFQILTTLLGYLKRASGTTSLRKITKETLQKVDEILFAKIVKQQMFSATGALQFATDLDAISQLTARLTGDSAAVETGLTRIQQASKLLNLPLSTGENDHDSNKLGAGDCIVDLGQAHETLVSSSPTEARELLESLGIDRLGTFEAGRVVVRRIETGG